MAQSTAEIPNLQRAGQEAAPAPVAAPAAAATTEPPIDPTVLVFEVLSYCAALSASGETLPSIALPFHAQPFDPLFLWAPRGSRSAVYAWARDAFIAQLAGTTQPFEDLPDDCAGDVLEHFEMFMTRSESLYITMHCSSPEACAWVREVVEAAAARAKATVGLVHAAMQTDLATVQDCVLRGADVDDQDDCGDTALIWAACSGCIEIVRLLVEAGADTDARGDRGDTALIWAAKRGCIENVRLLLEAGADTDAQSDRGDTALISAANRGCTEIVRLLLEAGADKDVRGHDGRSALNWATFRGFNEVTALLED